MPQLTFRFRDKDRTAQYEIKEIKGSYLYHISWSDPDLKDLGSGVDLRRLPLSKGWQHAASRSVEHQHLILEIIRTLEYLPKSTVSG